MATKVPSWTINFIWKHGAKHSTAIKCTDIQGLMMDIKERRITEIQTLDGWMVIDATNLVGMEVSRG